MISYMTPSPLQPEQFQVGLTDRSGWVWGTTRLPREGEEIFCAAGIGTVTKLHGKTGDGSRLVQIGFADSKIPPFFAAASNVLLPPLGAAVADDMPPGPPGQHESPAPAETEVWFGASGPRVHLR